MRMTKETESRHGNVDTTASGSEAELAAFVADSFRQKRKLHVCGGGTRNRYSFADDSVVWNVFFFIC